MNPSPAGAPGSSADDVGWFGPDSVTWRIHREPVAMVGGLRALLLQALHPEAMALLYAQSNFQDDPWSRLQRTVAYVATVSFAPTAVVDEAAAHVRAVHRRLGVDDPGLLLWVHVGLVDSFLAAAGAAGLRLSRADRDRYVLEQVRAAELVGLPAADVPTSVAEIAGYLASIRPRLAGTAQAREAARCVLAPGLPVPRRFAVPARLGWLTVSSLAVGLLPGWARRLYGLPPLPLSAVSTAAGLRTLRSAVRALPVRYREGPLYRAARQRALALAD